MPIQLKKYIIIYKYNEIMIEKLNQIQNRILNYLIFFYVIYETKDKYVSLNIGL